MEATIAVVLRKGKENQRGEAPLCLRITINRKSTFKSLKINLRHEQWDESKRQVRKSHPNSTRLNNLILQKLKEAQDELLKLQLNGKAVTTENAKAAVTRTSAPDFFSFADKLVERERNNWSLGTYDRYLSVLSKLKTFLKADVLPMDAVTPAFLREYEYYCHYKLSNKANTIHANMKVVRKVVNDAITEELLPMDKNPFLKYKPKTEKTSKQYLTEEELKRLAELPLAEGSKQALHRDLYIFASYAGGIRIGDLLTLRHSNFDGTHIRFQSRKTRQQTVVKLPTKALEIVQRYRQQNIQAEEWLFPALKSELIKVEPKALDGAISSVTALINKNLKLFASKAGIDKNLSFHLSRHTFATQALRKGIPLEYTSKLMGHANIRETQIYAKIINEELDKAMDVFE